MLCFLCNAPVCCSLSNSKLSIHTGLGSLSWQFIKQAQPRIVKILDNFGSNPAAVKAAAPGCKVIGRIYLPSQPQTGDPTQAAQAWWNSVQSTILSSPDVDYWEGYNEPSIGSVQDMTWYSQFEVARIGILAQHGRNASIGQFSTGTPDVTNAAVINAFLPAIEAALAQGGILAVHEYSSPTLQGCFDPSSGEGWFTMRYRKWYREFLIPQGKVIPLAITEFGIDNSACSSPNLGGWSAYCSWWQSNLPNHPTDCNAEYVSQMAWYDGLMQEDSYVLGATIFCLEISGWQQYDISPVVPDLIKYMASA